MFSMVLPISACAYRRDFTVVGVRDCSVAGPLPPDMKVFRGGGFVGRMLESSCSHPTGHLCSDPPHWNEMIK